MAVAAPTCRPTTTAASTQRTALHAFIAASLHRRRAVAGRLHVRVERRRILPPLARDADVDRVQRDGLRALVARDVDVVRRLDEALARRVPARRTAGVLAVVERQRAARDR